MQPSGVAPLSAPCPPPPPPAQGGPNAPPQVGAGWAGVYAAWRLAVDAAAVRPEDLCLFDARGEFGGRTYSVHVPVGGGKPLVVDVGAYRFAKEMHLPGDLIRHLNLSCQCYKPSCGKEEGVVLYRIVDASNNSAGYNAAMRSMIDQMLAAGSRLFLGHALTAILEWESESTGRIGEKPPMRLLFSNNVSVKARAALLNLPRRTIQGLRSDSLMFRRPLSRTLLRRCVPGSIKGFKVYAVYKEPWWATRLNLTEGYFSDVSRHAPFIGRYHDGAIRRLAGGHLGAGALEVLYTYTQAANGSFDWYLQYRQNLTDPLTLSENPELLSVLHARLMAYHASNFLQRGINSSTIALPVKVVMGFWDSFRATSSFLSNPEPINLFHDKRPGEQGKCLQNVSAGEYISTVSAPTQGGAREYDIFLANNDYYYEGLSGAGCCWAENSLKPMEKLLRDRFELRRPAWLNESYYERDIAGYGPGPSGALAALLV